MEKTDVNLSPFFLREWKKKQEKNKNNFYVFHIKTEQLLEIEASNYIDDTYILSPASKKRGVEAPLPIENCLTIDEYDNSLKHRNVQVKTDNIQVKNKQETSNEQVNKLTKQERINKAKDIINRNKDFVDLISDKTFFTRAKNWAEQQPKRKGKIKEFKNFLELDTNTVLPNYIIDFANLFLSEIKLPEKVIDRFPANKKYVVSRTFANRRDLKKTLLSFSMPRNKIKEVLEKAVFVNAKYSRSQKTINIVAAMQFMENNKFYRRLIGFLLKSVKNKK